MRAERVESGRPAGDDLDTSAASQTKVGRLTGNGGFEGHGTSCGGDFADTDGSGNGDVEYGDDGVRGYGNSSGGNVSDLDGSGRACVVYSNFGIEAFGNLGGGYFSDSDSSGYADCAFGFLGYADTGAIGHGTLPFADRQTLRWEPERSVGTYDLYRGLLTSLSGPAFGTCFAFGMTDTVAIDAGAPPRWKGWFYLATAVNRLQEEGTKGWQSSGLERANPAPCP